MPRPKLRKEMKKIKFLEIFPRADGALLQSPVKCTAGADTRVKASGMREGIHSGRLRANFPRKISKHKRQPMSRKISCRILKHL